MPSVINSFVWKFIERIGTQSVSFVVSIILARMLMPSDYGYIAIIMTFISFANVIIEGGLNSALIQKKECDNIDYSTVVFVSILASTILYSILYFIAPYIGAFYNYNQLTAILRVLGIVLFFGAVNSVQNAFLVKNLQFKKLFYSSFSSVIVSAIIGISMAKIGFGIWALVAQNIALIFTTMIVMWFTVKWRPEFHCSFIRFKQLYSFGWKIFATNTIITIFLNIRSLIIGRVYSSSSLAFFDRGKSLPSIAIDNINTSIQSVMFPVLSMRQDSTDGVKQMMSRSIRVSSYIIYPILIGLIVIAEPLVKLLLTNKWLPAVPYVQIFCVANLFMPIQNVNMVAIKALGYSSIILNLEIIKKIIELTILIISVKINVIAIAWGVAIYNFICIFINLYPTKKILNYSYREQISDVTPPCLISVLMGVIIYPIQIYCDNTFITIILSITGGIIIYILISKLLNIDSYKYLQNLLLKKIKHQ